MSESWLDRLKIAVERDGRAMREISAAANKGPNFVSQMFKNGKKPSVDNFMSVLSQLGTSSMIYVLTGREFSAQDEEFLRLILDLDEVGRAKAMENIRDLQELQVLKTSAAS